MTMSQQCPCGQKGQWYLELQQEASGQQVEGVDLAPLLGLKYQNLSPSVKERGSSGESQIWSKHYARLKIAMINQKMTHKTYSLQE
ncbi:hypothetical protein DUI87_08024 [Hirundo rustica rustica]|uniref:Uncharacterized protein n=1 Tax=Hirundo rustica rustica TaxID=333673 RepID=A0A3M0KYJ5_HIRRU|nr:hypothetical protein DUI87_08024 [Hirundo rustica rustica]